METLWTLLLIYFSFNKHLFISGFWQHNALNCELPVCRTKSKQVRKKISINILNLSNFAHKFIIIK